VVLSLVLILGSKCLFINIKRQKGDFFSMETQKETSDFWQDHSLVYLEMAFRNERRERLAKPDGYGKKTGDCGDTIEFFLNLADNIVVNLSYDIDGCMNTNACCNAIVSMVEGKSVEAAWDTTPEKVAGFLESLPKDHFHCAELAVGTLYLALANARETQRHPWKKAYR
jgi:nitrogen fixation NifU-like protein